LPNAAFDIRLCAKSIVRAAALALAMPGGPAAAQDFRDWQAVKAADRCIATTSVGLAGPDSGLATLAVFPRGGGAVVTVRVPLGADLSAGIAYTHPGRDDAVGLAWQSCDSETCLAAGTLSDAEIGRLEAGRSVYLGFRPLPGSPGLIAPVSLLGFTRAWAATRACD
jgi:invasion protein IalB